MHKLNMLLATLLLSCSVYAGNSSWDTLRTDQYNLVYPSDWEKSSAGGKAKVAFLSPQESAQDSFRENVNLIVQELPEGITLEQYTEQTKKGMDRYIKNATMILSETVEKSGSKCQHLLYSGAPQGRMLMFEQYFWVREGKAYVLTFTAEQAAFDDYREVSRTMLNSFRFVKK